MPAECQSSVSQCQLSISKCQPSSASISSVSAQSQLSLRNSQHSPSKCRLSVQPVSAQLQPGSSAPASVSRASVHQCQSVKGQHVAVEFAASECSRCAVSERFRQCWLNFLYSARIAFPCNVDDFRSVLPQRMQVQGVPTTVGSRSRSPPVSYTHLTLPTNREV